MTQESGWRANPIGRHQERRLQRERAKRVDWPVMTADSLTAVLRLSLTPHKWGCDHPQTQAVTARSEERLRLQSSDVRDPARVRADVCVSSNT